MAEEQQQRWDTAPLQGTGTMAGARDKKPYFYSNHENCAGAITTLLRHICFQSPSAPPGSSRLPQSLRPRRDELQNFSRANTEEEGRAKSYRVVCGRVEAGIPTAPEADGEPHSSSSSPEKADRRRTRRQTNNRRLCPGAARPPLRFRPAAGTAQARRRRPHGGGGGGAGGRRRPGGRGGPGRLRPLRAVPLRGGIPGKPRGPGTGTCSFPGQRLLASGRMATAAPGQRTPVFAALVACGGWALLPLQTATLFDTQVGFLSCECHGIAQDPKK